MNGTLHIKTCLFGAEATAIHAIRDRVFHEEQGIDPALDWDGRDQAAVHLVAFLNQQPVGVARLREVEGAIALKLERLAVLPEYRRQGIGSELVHTALVYGQQQHYSQMFLNAQLSAVNLYQSLGFTSIDAPFIEAHILHVKMHKALQRSQC